MSKISFYAWSITKEAEDLMTRIMNAIRVMLPKDHPVEIEIIDIASYGDIEHVDGWGLVFGTKALQHISWSGDKERVVVIPPIDRLFMSEDNKVYRSEATETLKKLVSRMIEGDRVEEDEVKACIVTKDGITIGEQDTDIEISEKTITYLKKIRDFLGGGKVVITKGDIRVEVD